VRNRNHSSQIDGPQIILALTDQKDFAVQPARLIEAAIAEECQGKANAREIIRRLHKFKEPFERMMEEQKPFIDAM
jgi:hypothetical protein